VFLNLLGAAEGALIRAAASTQPLGRKTLDLMKRILFSAGGGIVFQIVYFVLVWLIVSIVQFINGSARGDSWWFYLLATPLEWGGRFYNVLFPAQFERPYALLKFPAIVSDVVGAFLLFAVLTYAFLWLRSHQRRFA
jgi:hypothetical protein